MPVRVPTAERQGRKVKIQLWGWECERCGHQWVPRDMKAEPDGPRVCPKCKSPYWDRPRRIPKG